MLFGANHVGDLHVMIIDCTGEVVETSAVRTLYYVVLFLRPGKLQIAANEIVKPAVALAWHLQSNDGGPSFGLESRLLLGRFSHPSSAVDKPLAFLLGLLTFGFKLLGASVVSVGMASREQVFDRLPMSGMALRLEVGFMRTPDLWAFIPVQSEPTKSAKYRIECLGDVALLIGIVDTKNEVSALVSGEQPVEQCGADPTDMQKAGRAWSESCPNHGFGCETDLNSW